MDDTLLQELDETGWDASLPTPYINIDMFSDILDEIAELEEDFLDRDKEHLKYYLGSVYYCPEYNSIQLGTSVSPSTVLSYNILDIQLYLAEYSISNILVLLPHVHILQLDIKLDGEYCVIIKTFWLKIVQRAWKKQYAKRKEIIMLRGSLVSQRHFELTGNYHQTLRNIPGLCGLLT